MEDAKVVSFSQDETFPELGIGSIEGCDDQESICSNNERDGDAFPKAFERELITPQNSQVDESTDTDTKDSVDIKANETDNTSQPENSQLGKELKEIRSLEERRRSLLDHHWAVPSKDRFEHKCFRLEALQALK